MTPKVIISKTVDYDIRTELRVHLSTIQRMIQRTTHQSNNFTHHQATHNNDACARRLASSHGHTQRRQHESEKSLAYDGEDERPYGDRCPLSPGRKKVSSALPAASALETIGFGSHISPFQEVMILPSCTFTTVIKLTG